MDFWTSLWNFLWFLFCFYVFIAFLAALFAVFGDLFRDTALNGWAKALWVIVLVFLPIISVLVYLIARGSGMAVRNQQRAEVRKEAQDEYIRSVAAPSAAEEISRARALLDAGSVTEAEYEVIKKRALSG
jgi:ABC-type multidrug transport system fused ATPase/permease subunit